MDLVRLQAKDMRALEAYVDAQNGGPGKGWYRIVTDARTEARKVINAGKLAVVMGIETSSAVRLHAEARRPGPQVHPGDLSTGSSTRSASWASRSGVGQQVRQRVVPESRVTPAAPAYSSTGPTCSRPVSAWRMQTCNPNDPEIHDRDQSAAAPIDSGDLPAQDAIFGAVAEASGVTLPSPPLYPAPHHCNSLGLTDLGAHTIEGLAKRHMLFDPDHMSVKARKASMDLVESMNYSGVSPATRGRRRTPTPASTGTRASSRRTPGTATAS